MKQILFAFLVVLVAKTNAQHGYWQQHVDYQMEITMDTEKHQFTGTQKLVYTNNSPDTLNRVFYHLYFNAFQPGSMMDQRSETIQDPDKRIAGNIAKLKQEEIGYQKVTMLTQSGFKQNCVNRCFREQVQRLIWPLMLRYPFRSGEVAAITKKTLIIP